MPAVIERISTPLFRLQVQTLHRVLAAHDQLAVTQREWRPQLAAFNHRRQTPLPRIVCICAEYADLLLGDRQQRRELERQVSRLGAKARAAGRLPLPGGPTNR